MRIHKSYEPHIKVDRKHAFFIVINGAMLGRHFAVIFYYIFCVFPILVKLSLIMSVLIRSTVLLLK
jgi:hypothetical protein